MDRLTELALAAGRGSADALDELVAATRDDVWRLCRALGDAGDADDLVQETYLRAVRGLPRFRADASARTWLLSIARRVAADAVRRKVRDRRLLTRVRPAADEPAPDGVTDLAQLIDALSPERRDAFVLTQVVGLDYAAAAEVIGCPVGTIRSRVARARRDLVAAVADVAAWMPEPSTAGERLEGNGLRRDP